MDINDLAMVVHTNSREHGFWDGQDPQNPTVIAAKLALIHSEVSEALEAVRETGTDSWTAENGKPMGFGPELADVIIRVLDLTEACDVDVEYWLERKHAYNRARPHMHGGKKL